MEKHELISIIRERTEGWADYVAILEAVEKYVKEKEKEKESNIKAKAIKIFERLHNSVYHADILQHNKEVANIIKILKYAK